MGFKTTKTCPSCFTKFKITGGRQVLCPTCIKIKFENIAYERLNYHLEHSIGDEGYFDHEDLLQTVRLSENNRYDVNYWHHQTAERIGNTYVESYREYGCASYT